jgi:hypothetical protein
MTYSSLVTGYIEINEELRARNYFDKISNHFSGPFLVRKKLNKKTFMNVYF